MKQIICISFLLFIQSTVFAQWLQTSGPSGGGVSDFAFVNGKILAATFDLGNGVFASTDSGTSWHESGLQGVMLTHITAHDSIVIASSTQNSYNETDTIYRSSDAGASWQEVLSLPNINAIGTICYHNHQWFLSALGSAGDMYQSNDDGISWTSFRPPLFNFSHPIILLSAGVDLLAAINNNGHIGIYRSSDGSTWNESVSGIDTTVASEIFSGTVSGNTIFFGKDGGIIYSNDGGISWTEPALPSLKGRSEYIARITGSGNTIIAISSQNNVFTSHDGGQTWINLIGNGLPINASYFFSVGFDEKRGVVYLGASSGILSQSILSNQWNYHSDGLRAAAVSEVAAIDGKVFAVTERGVSFSSDIGSSWHDPKNLADLNDVSIIGFLKGSANFYAFGDGLYSFNGASWNPIDTSHLTALAESSSGRLFATRQSGDPISGTSEIDISDSGGTSWGTALSFTNSIDTEMYFLPHCLSSNGSSVIVAVQRAIIFQTFSSVYIVYRSSDNGFSWQQTATVKSPAFVTFADNTFYMGTYGSGLFRSIDNGITWTQFSGLASGVDINSLLKINATIFISVIGNGNARDGLYFSKNDGVKWIYANNNTENIFGPLATDGTYLFSTGPSVWRRQLQGLDVHDTETTPSISHLEIYPNPAGDMIHLHITSSQPVSGTLIIYDEKGIIVSKQEAYLENNADVQISLTGISEGVYNAKLIDKIGVAIATTKFVVQRR